MWNKHKLEIFNATAVLVLTSLNLCISGLIRYFQLFFVRNDLPIGFSFGYFSSVLILAFVTWCLFDFHFLSRSPVASVLILVGIWSNFLEKCLFEAVADYINLGLLQVNLADLQLVVGLILINIQIWFFNKNNSKNLSQIA